MRMTYLTLDEMYGEKVYPRQQWEPVAQVETLIERQLRAAMINRQRKGLSVSKAIKRKLDKERAKRLSPPMLRSPQEQNAIAFKRHIRKFHYYQSREHEFIYKATTRAEFLAVRERKIRNLLNDLGGIASPW